MHDFHDDLAAGAAYALYRHGQDAQTEELAAAFAAGQQSAPPPPVVDGPPIKIDLNLRFDPNDGDDYESAQVVNALDWASDVDMPASWDDYIGQEPLKLQMQVAVNSALARGDRLPHMLFASGMPGVGKTTIARLMAKQMGRDGKAVGMIELVPPFDNVFTFVKAAEQLLDGEILFIDEIHLLMQKRNGAALLLKALEEGTVPLPNGEIVVLNKITVLAATTDSGVLPQTVLDRFRKKPHFQAYSMPELGRITVKFAAKHDCLHIVDNQLALAIAKASRGTPRIIETMVLEARDLAITLGAPPSTAQLLSYLEVEPDGMTRTHVHYLTAMRQYFRRTSKEGDVEYIVGEAAMLNILRETKQGLGQVERFLIERGMIDRTPRGRRLTPRGIARAEEFIAAGKGSSDVA